MGEISVNRALLDNYKKQIGKTGIVLYLFLATLVNSERKVTIRVKQLAEMMELSPETIIRVLRRMERANVISVIPNFEEHGGNKANTYELLV